MPDIWPPGQPHGEYLGNPIIILTVSSSSNCLHHPSSSHSGITALYTVTMEVIDSEEKHEPVDELTKPSQEPSTTSNCVDKPGMNPSLPAATLQAGSGIVRNRLHLKNVLILVLTVGFAGLVVLLVLNVVTTIRCEDHYRQLYEKINALERSYNSTQRVHGGGPDPNNTYDQPDSENFTTLFNNIKETRRDIEMLASSLENLSSEFEQLKVNVSEDLSRVNSSLQQYISEELMATVLSTLENTVNRTTEELFQHVESEISDVRRHISTEVLGVRGHVDTQVSELNMNISSQYRQLETDTRVNLSAVNSSLRQETRSYVNTGIDSVRSHINTEIRRISSDFNDQINHINYEIEALKNEATALKGSWIITTLSTVCTVITLIYT